MTELLAVSRKAKDDMVSAMSKLPGFTEETKEILDESFESMSSGKAFDRTTLELPQIYRLALGKVFEQGENKIFNGPICCRVTPRNIPARGELKLVSFDPARSVATVSWKQVLDRAALDKQLANPFKATLKPSRMETMTDKFLSGLKREDEVTYDIYTKSGWILTMESKRIENFQNVEKTSVIKMAIRSSTRK